jgi:Protein of unknown function (DUF2804)
MVESITPEQPAGCLTAEQFLAGRGLFDYARPLKRWRWVGIFSEQLMLCAAQVQIGPGRQTFWAMSPPGGGAMRERTRLMPRRGEVELTHGTPDGAVPGALRIRDRGVVLEISLTEQPGFQARCPNGRSEAWTRKQAGIKAEGTLRIDGGTEIAVNALAVIDDSAGYHARVTEWRWSAGVGSGPDGAPLAWNLVSGINDPLRGSERAIWQDGLPSEAPPVLFADDLSSIRSRDGSKLDFTSVAERSRHDNLLLLSSDYRAPFGRFEGTLPGGVELASGLGVMEHHRARW